MLKTLKNIPNKPFKDNHYLYIVEFENGCKIGRTKNHIDKRIYAYTRPWCHQIKSVYVQRNENAQSDETMIKRLLSHNGISEFLPNIHPADVIKYLSQKNETWFIPSSSPLKREEVPE